MTRATEDSVGLVRITEAFSLGGYRLRLTLTSGAVIERDVGPLLVGPVFEPLLRDPALFAGVTVDDGTVVWPIGADLDPDVLIWGGPPPAEENALPPTGTDFSGRSRA